jgi:hypothetical protein
MNSQSRSHSYKTWANRLWLNLLSRLSCVLGMLRSLGVKVPCPT